MFDEMRIEYFAVSLPDFLIFDEDLNKRNHAHCEYLIGLGYLGLGDMERASKAFSKVEQLDFNHMLCRIYQKMVK